MVNASEITLPCLIHGIDKTGASFFTMNLVLNYLKEGKKILFYSAFKPAKDFLTENTPAEIHEVITHINQRSSKQLIIPLSGNLTLFTDMLKDNYYDEYIIVVKNCELINNLTAHYLTRYEKIIYSGNILKTQEINTNNMKSTILFSDLDAFGVSSIELDKYQGYLIGKGTVSLI